MSDNIEDFTDTSDVSDAAIEWVLQATGSPAFSAESVRSDAGRGYPADRARMIAALLIQRHYPELLVDPVVKLIRELLVEAREIVGKTYNWSQRSFDDDHPAVASTLAALRRGMELGKADPVRPPLTREELGDAIVKVFNEGAS